MKFGITARWDFEVADEQALISYVRERLVADRGYSVEAAAEHSPNAERALVCLLELDGELPDYEPSILRDGGSGFTVVQVEKTLYDMNADERMESRVLRSRAGWRDPRRRYT